MLRLVTIFTGHQQSAWRPLDIGEVRTPLRTYMSNAEQISRTEGVRGVFFSITIFFFCSTKYEKKKLFN